MFCFYWKRQKWGRNMDNWILELLPKTKYFNVYNWCVLSPFFAMDFYDCFYFIASIWYQFYFIGNFWEIIRKYFSSVILTFTNIRLLFPTSIYWILPSIFSLCTECTWMCIYICICICLCIGIWVFVHLYVYVYIYEYECAISILKNQGL